MVGVLSFKYHWYEPILSTYFVDVGPPFPDKFTSGRRPYGSSSKPSNNQNPSADITYVPKSCFLYFSTLYAES